MATAAQTQAAGRFARIAESYLGLPNWVRFWMNFILGPVNLGTLAFLYEPGGALIASLAIGGMVMTVAIVFLSGGFNKLASAGHIVPWVPLVALLAIAMPDGTATYKVFLTLLMVINAVSLVFDINDLRVWVTARTTS